MKTIPFWTDDFSRPGSLKTSTIPSEVDVAIVGGGYTGLNAARVVAQNGGSVAVLEQHTIGWGASSRNGGMATTGLKESAATISKRYGPQLGRQFWDAALDAIDLIGQLVVEEGIVCDFLRKGHVELAAKPSHFAAMKEQAAWLKKNFNHSMMLVGPADLGQEIGSNVYHGGLVDEFSGGLHPAKYVFGLAEAAARHGALLCENSPVSQIVRQGKGFQLQVQPGRNSLKAKEVLIATNGYTTSLVPTIRRGVFPAGSYIIVTPPLSADLQKKLSPKGRMFFDSKNFLHYFRLTPDGRLLFGGRNDLTPDLDLNESSRRLRQQMVQVFPELQDTPITHSWTGQLGLTFDLMPHIGREDGVWYALGYCGHGVAVATYLGTEIGLLLAGKKNRSPFMEIAHQKMFFYRQRPWFLPLAATYYRFLDWIS